MARGFYEPLVEAMRNIGSEESTERCARGRERLRELGATFPPPGGLTRVAKPDTLVVNSSGGGMVKDTWVLKTPKTAHPA